MQTSGAHNKPVSPVSLYFGKVMHARLKPVQHRFVYKVFSLLIDIEQLQQAGKTSRLFAVNRPGLISFQERDHGYRDSRSLREFVDAKLAENNLQSDGHVALLCYPRVFGYTFNPLSVYFCHSADGELNAIIYQVHNTFGASHSYVKPVNKRSATDIPIRQETDKALYVSPFIDMAMRYKFRISPPGDSVRVRILEIDKAGPLLSATFAGEYAPMTSGNLARGLLQTMGLTWKVTAGIHFEAFRLWLKGVKLVPRLAK